jgi:hypothetical protein
MNQQPVLRRFGMEPRSQAVPVTQALVEDRYRIESQIGYGAFGKVYRARDIRTEELVAVKFFDERIDDTGYLQELGLLFSEEHPNIVRTLSFGYLSGRKYIIYEFIRGGSLRDLLIRQPRVPMIDALGIMADVMRGLAFAHQRRVVHRDLKPENLLLTTADFPLQTKLCDFGLSTRFRPGDPIRSYFGSPAYMAPEQFGQAYDHRVDLYAAGVILYEMLFGRRPHAGDAVSLRHAHLHVPPAMPSDGPEEIVDLLSCLMAKQPEDRPASAEEALARIEAAQEAQRQRPLAALPAPDFRTVQTAHEWDLDVPAGCVALAGCACGGLLVSTPDRVLGIRADGTAQWLLDTDVPIVEFAEGAHLDHLLAWVWDEQVWIWEQGQVRRLDLAERLPEGARRLVLSPDRRHLLIAGLNWVDLVDLAQEETIWRADLCSYGTPPECGFTPGSDCVWLSSEAPRTQLVALSIVGDKLSRTAGPGGDAVLLPNSDGSVVVGSRGRRGLQRINLDGFVTAELETGASLVELHPVTERLGAAWSVRHIEIFDRQTLATLALISRPEEHERLLAAGRGLYLVDVQTDALTVRRLRWDLSAGDDR